MQPFGLEHLLEEPVREGRVERDPPLAVGGLNQNEGSAGSSRGPPRRVHHRGGEHTSPGDQEFSEAPWIREVGLDRVRGPLEAHVDQEPIGAVQKHPRGEPRGKGKKKRGAGALSDPGSPRVGRQRPPAVRARTSASPSGVHCGRSARLAISRAVWVRSRAIRDALSTFNRCGSSHGRW